MSKHKKIEEDEESKRILREYRETVRASALELVLKTLPQKLVQLDKAVQSDARLKHTSAEVDEVFRHDLAEARAKVAAEQQREKEEQQQRKEGALAETPSKRRKLPDGSSSSDKTDDADEADADRVKDSQMCLPSNRAVIESIEVLRAELLEMVDTAGKVKLWIQLNIPRIEDGNNFGVGVQEDTMGELTRAEENSYAQLESITKYFIERAKLVTRCFRYPRLADYEHAVSELDQKQYLENVLGMVDLRNNYALLYDMIIKNIGKLENPRGSEHMSHLF